MELMVNLHTEHLPEGLYLATSDDIQGLVAQGCTLQEALVIASNVARKLLDAQAERQADTVLPAIAESFDYPLVIGS
jgi:predicted RNase H-like HicB family nuclease